MAGCDRRASKPAASLYSARYEGVKRHGMAPCNRVESAAAHCSRACYLGLPAISVAHHHLISARTRVVCAIFWAFRPFSAGHPILLCLQGWGCLVNGKNFSFPDPEPLQMPVSVCSCMHPHGNLWDLWCTWTPEAHCACRLGCWQAASTSGVVHGSQMLLHVLGK
jgi:hypothetical protein